MSGIAEVLLNLGYTISGSDLKLTPATDRLAMVRLAIRGHPTFGVSEWEIRQRRVVYTIETLTHFRRQRPREPNDPDSAAQSGRDGGDGATFRPAQPTRS